MELERLTEKSLYALREAERLAKELGNGTVESLHLARALMGDASGLIPSVADAAGADVAGILGELDLRIARLPKLSGAGYDAGKIYIYKVNVDNEKEIAEAFGITSLPTIVFVPMKGNPSAGTGFLPKETLRGAIKDLLLDKGAGKK